MKKVIASIIVAAVYGTISLPAQHSFIEGTITDERDGQEYITVKIGDRWWMAENLNYETPEGSWCYDDDPMICDKFGRLYTWDAANGACPQGWHLPSDDDWMVLEGNFGVPVEELNEMGWRPLRDGSLLENLKGFKMIMAGYRPYGDGAFDDLCDDAYFWTSTGYDEIDAWKRTFDDDRKEVGRGYDSKRKGLSVRCVKD